MKTLFKTCSTNGRWGVEIVGPSTEEDLSAVPRKGSLRPLGSNGGFSCFEFVPGGDHFVVIAGDVEVLAGASVVHAESLQNSDFCSLLHVAPGGLYKTFGYKRRSERFVQVLPDGNTCSPSPGILLAAGVIQPKEEQVAPAPAPPAFNPAMEEALRKAGILK